MKKFLFIFMIQICFANYAYAVVYIKDNGVIKIKLNQNDYPMITSLSILGKEVMPHDNAGADFQMTSRSEDGNAYNPTQGGDCWGRPSKLTGVIQNYNSGLGISANNGILLGVQPRNYNEPGTGQCAPGGLVPYSFNFGVTLGDGSRYPREMMILDMSIKKNDSTAPNLVKRHSEMPVAFPRTTSMRYAYYSSDGNIFSPMEHNGTHNVMQWPAKAHVSRQGKVIMLSNVRKANTEPTRGTGLAFYSHKKTWLIAERRPTTVTGNLTIIDALGELSYEPIISGSGWHTLRLVIAVGSLNSIKGTIKKAKEEITEWGNWYQ